MGCYLSSPDDRVYVTEGAGKNFRYATASCQGWRREQEDAEDCLPHFDDDASLFILCDGHGGAEVAKYTVKHFPDFLKNHKEYKEGNYDKALEEAFIDFDKYLRTTDVLEELEMYAMDSKDGDKSDERNGSPSRGGDHSCSDEDVKTKPEPGNSSAGPSASEMPASTEPTAGNSSAEPCTSAGQSSKSGPTSVAEDVDSETLRKEAHIPIEDLISKYTGPINNKRRVQLLRHRSLTINGSPVIRSSQRNEEEDEDEPETASGEKNNQLGELEHSEDAPSSSSGPKPEIELIRKAMEQYFDKACDDEDEDDDSEFEVSGADDDDDSDNAESDEGNDDGDSYDEDGDDECEDDITPSRKNKDKKLQRKMHKRTAQEHSSSSESEEDDLSDEEFDDDEDDDDDDDDEKDADEKVGHFLNSRKFLAKQLESASTVAKPGIDSGCTVVVALVKSGMLYVASAGDSRCIVVMRDGQCKAMSTDHKPEDETELKRIQAANGSVFDGRVNGGLNLSRAFGDFQYKDANLDPREQIITPLPDVETLKLDFNEVEFIFLACDGIWNSMTNAKVAKFINASKQTHNNNLIDICMALFRKCLAPDTEGDGSGCDNMTCILVRYYTEDEMMDDPQINEQNDLKTAMQPLDGPRDGQGSDRKTVENSDEKSKEDGRTPSSSKRSADFDEADSKQTCKRRCLHLLEE